MSLTNDWTDIPVGTRVQKPDWDRHGHCWFGTVVQFTEPNHQGVQVEWGPNLFSWENAENLFLATSGLNVTVAQRRGYVPAAQRRVAGLK